MRVVTPAPRPVWHELLSRCPQALPEQSPQWMDAVTAAGPYSDASRLYLFDDGNRAVLPLVRRRGVAAAAGLPAYGSFPPNWGMGGPLGDHLDTSVAASVLDDLRTLRALRVALCPEPLQAAAWAEARGPDITVLPKRAHVLDLDGGVEKAHEKLAASTRYGIRKATRRGVRVVEDRTGELLPVYQRLRQDSLRGWAGRQHEPLPLARWRDARRNPPGKLRTLAEHLHGAFVLHVAYLDAEPVAATITLLGNTAHYTHGAMNRDLASTVRANELLQWTIIETACRAGCTTYHLGESGRSASLARFKERFGASPVDYLHLRLERLPLTRADDLARITAKRILGFRDPA